MFFSSKFDHEDTIVFFMINKYVLYVSGDRTKYNLWITDIFKRKITFCDFEFLDYHLYYYYIEKSRVFVNLKKNRRVRRNHVYVTKYNKMS